MGVKTVYQGIAARNSRVKTQLQVCLAPEPMLLFSHGTEIERLKGEQGEEGSLRRDFPQQKWTKLKKRGWEKFKDGRVMQFTAERNIWQQELTISTRYDCHGNGKNAVD